MVHGDKREKINPAKKRFYRKRVRVFNLVDKIKLWISRTGQLHGIKSMEIMGGTARLVTHCNKEFVIKNSLNSRSGRWLRNKWFVKVCSECRVPDWKLEKYSATLFMRYQGSMLEKIKGHASTTGSQVLLPPGGDK